MIIVYQSYISHLNKYKIKQTTCVARWGLLCLNSNARLQSLSICNYRPPTGFFFLSASLTNVLPLCFLLIFLSSFFLSCSLIFLFMSTSASMPYFDYILLFIICRSLLFLHWLFNNSLYFLHIHFTFLYAITLDKIIFFAFYYFISCLKYIFYASRYISQKNTRSKPKKLSLP